MSNLKILLKNNFNMLIGRLQGKKKRKSTSVAISLLVLGIFAILALYSLQAWSMFEGLGTLGLGKLCVFHAVITTTTVLLIVGIMRVSGKTKGNDADFLLSLPIKKRDIIISKIINNYLFDFALCFLMLMPFIVIYEITSPTFFAPVLIFGIIAVLLLPLLSVGISEIMDFVVVRLFNKIKYGNILKSLIPTVIYIVLIVLMLIKTNSYGTVEFDTMEAYFEDRWIANQVLTFIFDQTFVSVLVFVSITILPFVIGTILYAKNYGKSFGVYTNKKTTLELQKMHSPFHHLLKKELNGYFSTPAYLVNTIIGPIMIVVLSVFCASGSLGDILKSLELPLNANELAYIFTLAINFLIATTSISSVSVSLEGNNIWFLHTAPVPVNQIFMSKLFVPLIVVTPTILLSAIVAGFVFNGFVSAIILFAISLLFLLINAISGLMMNLWFPKLNWDNETQVVKQSLSVLLSMVLNMVIALLPVAIYLIFNISIPLTAIITAIIYFMLLIAFSILLFTHGKKLFYKLKQ